MTREHYDRYQEMEAQNAELRAQLAACSEEVQMLNEHLDDYRQENDYLSQKIYRIEHDLADERLENASREHFLLRHNTPGGGGAGGSGSRVSFYGVTEEIPSRGCSVSPQTNRTDSIFESTRADSMLFSEEEDSGALEDESTLVPETFIGLPMRASSVMEYSVPDRHLAFGGSSGSGGTLERRSMSYHDISDVQMQQYGYTASHLMAGRHGYPYDQDSEYIEDELVASSYYADEPIHQECMTCKDAEFRIEDLEKQITDLDEQVEGKDAFIENQEFELEEMKTQLRSLKLDKDIVQYELTKQVEFSTEKLNTTESCLKQKDQAYMDLLERFVSLEQSYEEMNTKLKNKVLEGSVLSEKLSAIEFDLMLAEEQLNKTSAKPTPFQNSTATSSDDEESCPDSPRVITSLNNDSDTSQDPLNHHYEKRYPLSRMERCSISQQPLKASDSSADQMWSQEDEEQEDQRIEEKEEEQKVENINRIRKKGVIQEDKQRSVRSVVTSFELLKLQRVTNIA